MKIQKDGNMYIVKADNFVNLQESKDYFFINAEEYADFLKGYGIYGKHGTECPHTAIRNVPGNCECMCKDCWVL